MLKQRIITTAIGLPLLIIIVWLGNPWFALGIAALAVLAGIEFYKICHMTGLKPAYILGLATIALLCFSFYCPLAEVKLILIAILIVISGIWFIFARNEHRHFNNLAWTLAGVLYIGLLLSYWGEIRNFPSGERWILWIIFIIMSGDISAFFIGRAWGKHFLAPSLSPKKTWEGATSGFIISIIIAFAFAWLFSLSIRPIGILITGMLVSILAQLGDLLESLLKRDSKIKDTGNFFPGHGGVLDRIDSYMLSGVFAYYYISFFVL